MMTTAGFIARAQAQHSERFDYALSEYRGFRAPVAITCGTHGVFWTTPKSHLHSLAGGCRKCVRRSGPGVGHRQSGTGFIPRARTVHGERYDYSRVRYVNHRIPVTVVCPAHGPFEMSPTKHLAGQGCRACANDRLSAKRRLSVWDVIVRIATAHGLGSYDYNLRGYINLHSPIEIRCHKHGWFSQRAAAHLKGHGCAKCCSSRGERSVRLALQAMGVEFLEQVRFPECRDRRPLPFDFFLPRMRTLIEYDGPQHFTKSELWGGHHLLELTQRHDAIRNRFAVANGLRLIRITYRDFNRVEEILRRELGMTSASVAAA